MVSTSNRPVASAPSASRRSALGLIVAAALAIYTTHKLYTMARIRGFVGERRIERHIVVGKPVEEDDARGRVFCFLSWDDDGAGRVQGDCDFCKQVGIGDAIEVVHIGGDERAYLRSGDIYTSDGNFEFDLALLALELGGIIYFSLRLSRATIGA